MRIDPNRFRGMYIPREEKEDRMFNRMIRYSITIGLSIDFIIYLFS